MSTDKFLLEGIKAGLHGTVKVTPIGVGANSRTELPSGGVPAQLLSRKTVMIQNVSSGTLYVGGYNVGFGVGGGGVPETSCSGIQIPSGNTFVADVGRAQVYVFNGSITTAHIKLLEIS